MKENQMYGIIHVGADRNTAHNSSYPKVAVRWLNQALCFYKSFCLVDSEALRNAKRFIHANRYGQV